VNRRKTAVLVAILSGTLIIWGWLSGVVMSVQLRLDTGELRFRYLGITYRTIRQPEYVIERLRAATSLPPRMEPRWFSGVGWKDVKDAERQGDYYYYYELYARASAWCAVSPGFGRLILDDIARIVQAGGWSNTGPECADPTEMTDLLVQRDSSRRWGLAPGWRESVYLKYYLDRKGTAARALLQPDEGKRAEQRSS